MEDLPAADFTFSGPSATSYGKAVLLQNATGDHWYYEFRRTQADTSATIEKRDFTLNDISTVDVTGGDGRDFLYGMTGSDTLTGGAGDDTIYGWDLRNQAYLPASAEMGGDDLSGGSGNDYIISSMGEDTIDGGEDDDILSGKEGADYIFGGQGKDVSQGF